MTEVSAAPASASTGNPTVVASQLHVTYHVYEESRPRLRELVARGLRKRVSREIQALRGVSLTARAGEVVGVIGANGSGKSTLMQAIAGLLPVSSGEVRVRSRPTLLGVGAALQPALSGRRNIELGGLALGMRRKELEARMDEIVEFSGLQRSIDLPLRTYSKGMRARLHFSIATAVRPEILLIDEALAVGDEEFKERSDERIAELRDGAGTVFIVSHALKALASVCTRIVWLDHGQVLAEGEPTGVVRAYRESVVRRKPKGRASAMPAADQE